MLLYSFILFFNLNIYFAVFTTLTADYVTDYMSDLNQDAFRGTLEKIDDYQTSESGLSFFNHIKLFPDIN